MRINANFLKDERSGSLGIAFDHDRVDRSPDFFIVEVPLNLYFGDNVAKEVASASWKSLCRRFDLAPDPTVDLAFGPWATDLSEKFIGSKNSWNIEPLTNELLFDPPLIPVNVGRKFDDLWNALTVAHHNITDENIHRKIDAWIKLPKCVIGKRLKSLDGLPHLIVKREGCPVRCLRWKRSKLTSDASGNPVFEFVFDLNALNQSPCRDSESIIDYRELLEVALRCDWTVRPLVMPSAVDGSTMALSLKSAIKVVPLICMGRASHKHNSGMFEPLPTCHATAKVVLCAGALLGVRVDVGEVTCWSGSVYGLCTNAMSLMLFMPLLPLVKSVSY